MKEPINDSTHDGRKNKAPRSTSSDKEVMKQVQRVRKASLTLVKVGLDMYVPLAPEEFEVSTDMKAGHKRLTDLAIENRSTVMLPEPTKDA